MAYLIDDLREEIASDRALLFVGAGVSMGATDDQVAGWEGLIRSGIQRVQDLRGSNLPDGWADSVSTDIKIGDLTLAAEKVAGKLMEPDGPEFKRWLRETIGKLKAEPGRDTVLRALGRCNVPIATTNYDNLIEDATGLRSATWRDPGMIQRVLRGEERRVLHLHGHFENSQSIVFGRSSYERLLGAETAQALQQAMAGLATLVFIGFGDGLADPNLGMLREWIARVLPMSEHRHYRLCLDSDKPALSLEHSLDERITVIGYGPTHGDLAGFLASLAPDAPSPSGASFVHPDAAAADVPSQPPLVGAWQFAGWRNVPFAHFDGRTAGEIWPDDPKWVYRYTHYMQALDLVARAGHYERKRDFDERNRLLDELGDASLGIWDGLDTTTKSRRELAAFVRRVMEAAFTELRRSAQTAIERTRDLGAYAIVGWDLWQQAPLSLEDRHRHLAEYTRNRPALDREQVFNVMRWHRGVAEADDEGTTNWSGASLRPGAAPWLQRLTSEIDSRLRQLRRPEAVFDDAVPFATLLPKDLQQKYAERTRELRTYRRELVDRGLGSLGISEDGLTEIQAQALPLLAERLRHHQTLLVIGPTSSGKTDIGRIAAASVASAKRKVVVLLPTKALVAQAAEEWRAFFSSVPSSKGWRIVQASRDYPRNDEKVAKGEYEVLIAISEKFASYVTSGYRVLEQCGLIIADELQFLSTVQRGANIESLLTLIRAKHPHIPMLALSAPLEDRTADAIERWLGADAGSQSGRITTKVRPVPLARYAFTKSARVGRDAHGTIERASWDLAAGLDVQNSGKPSRTERYQSTVALVVHLLARARDDGDDRSVLVFVGTRSDAETLTAAIRGALDAAGPATSQATNPRAWRFAGGMTPAAAAAWKQDLAGLPRLPASNHVRSGLRTGVAYHTARLDPEHRRIVERAFSTGCRPVRVIVATSTLAIGLNLPADHVIIADLLEATGEKTEGTGLPAQRLLGSHDVSQRLGRCGRLGQSTGGEAYIAVPSDLPAGRVALLPDQVADLNRLRGAPLPDDLGTATELALHALEDSEVVFGHLIDKESPGASITSSLDLPSFARILLQDMCRNPIAYTDADLAACADQIYRNSLLHAVRKAAYPVNDMVSLLEGTGLIERAPQTTQKWIISGLGRTIALSNVTIDNAPAIADVAEAGRAGAGPLTILAIAARAPFVRQMSWVRLPPRERELVERVRARVHAFTRWFLDPTAAGDLDTLDWEHRRVFEPFAGRDLIGEGTAADALRKGAGDDVDSVDDDTLVDRLRACLAYLWMSGVPMRSLLALIPLTEVDTGKPPKARVAYYPADIRDLGERLSYVVNGASETLRPIPTDGRHLALQNMTESLEVGLPYQTATLVTLEGIRIHRERLAALMLERIDHCDFDDVSDVLDVLGTCPPDVDVEAGTALKAQAFSVQEKEKIISELARLNVQTRGEAALPAKTRGIPLPPVDVDDPDLDPEPDREYRDVAEELARTNVDMAEHLACLTGLLTRFGLDATATPTGLLVRREGLPDTFELLCEDTPLRSADVDRLAGSYRVLLTFAGLGMGARHELREHTAQGFSVMSPWVFLAVLARIHDMWRRQRIGHGVPHAVLAERVVAFFRIATGPLGLSGIWLADAVGTAHQVGA